MSDFAFNRRLMSLVTSTTFKTDNQARLWSINLTEAELDAKLAALSIWKIPFQTIISSLFYTIEMIDKDGRHFVAADYTSRISYLYDIIRNKAASAPVVSSHEAIMHKDFVKYINDQLFLNAYAHYSLLMPQFHRGTF